MFWFEGEEKKVSAFCILVHFHFSIYSCCHGL